MIHKKYRVWTGDFKLYKWTELPTNIEYDIIKEKFVNRIDPTESFDGWILEQFTGVEDKNNTPIYEGDILEIEVNNVIMYAVVTYNDDYCGYIAEWKSEKTPRRQNFIDLNCDSAYNSQVVGNRHVLPCNPDHNGECLVCDCWESNCQVKECIYGSNI